MTPLMQYRETLFQELRVAVRKRDVSAILESAKKLETLETLIALAEKPVPPLTTNPPRETGHGQPTGNGTKLSPKARGIHYRNKFVQTLRSKSIALQPIKGPIFETRAGKRVGIAYAREGNKHNKEKWFSGLPENQFDQVVLLCEEESGKMTFFSLPKDFMDRLGNGLSCASGQVKFSVFRRGEEFYLKVPRQIPVNLEPYRDNFDGLR